MADPHRRRRTWWLAAGAVVVLAAAVVVAYQLGRAENPPTTPAVRGNITTQSGEIVASSANGARRYADGPVYAHVTGVLSPAIDEPGLERAEENTLAAGNTVVTTIDARVQSAAYDAMVSEGFTGAVVAIKPDDGQILAMVSTPSYDPNTLTRSYDQYRDAPEKPLLNRAISENYSPGSTFTLVTAAAALADGGDPRVTTSPGIDVVTGDLGCDAATSTCLTNYNRASCGDGTLRGALAESCNTAFAQLADQVGEEKLLDQAARFGIGQTDLAIPMPVEPSCIGVADECMTIADRPSLFQSGIGQKDVRLTPLENCVITATIANGGTRMRPQLVRQDGRYAPDEAEQAMASDDANELRDMMVSSEENTGGSGRRADLTIASKTGTAATGGDPRSTPPFAWYVAFAPAENPRIAVAVLVESKDVAATGSARAAGVGRATINALI